MAKAAKTKTDSDKKSVRKAGTGTMAKSKKAKKAKKAGPPKSERHGALENLAKLAEHPLVADLLAVGAVAAVAALAQHQSSDKKQPSSKLVKAAGKAAAAAIGAKLMGELGTVAGAATDAAKKG